MHSKEHQYTEHNRRDVVVRWLMALLQMVLVLVCRGMYWKQEVPFVATVRQNTSSSLSQTQNHPRLWLSWSTYDPEQPCGVHVCGRGAYLG
jgi:hypothetical protein